MAPQKTIKRIVALVIIANLVIMMVVFLGAPAKPSKPLPNPNGFDDFMRAGQLVSSTGGLSNNPNPEDLRKLVEQNSDALKWVRKGLTNETRIPEDDSTNYFANYQPIMGSFKQLALALEDEGRLTETEQRTNDAAMIYLDAVRFGEECTRSGVIIWKLHGIACESIGLRNLERLTNSLDAKASRNAAQMLEKLDANEEPVEECLNNEKNWVRKAYSLRGQVQIFFTHKLVDEGRKNFVKKYQANQLRRRELILAFATRAYELDKGRPPPSAFALPPDYLKVLPKDPFTGTNMVKRAQPQ
jgi:hypothetical protein